MRAVCQQLLLPASIHQLLRANVPPEALKLSSAAAAQGSSGHAGAFEAVVGLLGALQAIAK